MYLTQHMRKVLSLLSESAEPKKTLLHDLAKENACYILITCGQPSKEGEMQVEMRYEGDASLAAYLIETAQGFIEKQE